MPLKFAAAVEIHLTLHAKRLSMLSQSNLVSQ